jgi:hypothetical protein
MEREMWTFFVQQSLLSDSQPLFPEAAEETGCWQTSGLPPHLL